MFEYSSRVLPIGLGLIAASVAACVMAHDSYSAPRCRVVGGDALSMTSGGSPALCAVIEQALGPASGGKLYSVEVRVRTRFLEAAVMTPNGLLPLLRFAEHDSAVGAPTFGRFAAAIARHIANHRSRDAFYQE